ncbi:hypothetical protein BC834DRAFT_387498 [Gloeopeniophorella convolvens]|nr:hypothetical protein BC834DRAFT_387498 [Gloeopeniophorella convolvens]
MAFDTCTRCVTCIGSAGSIVFSAQRHKDVRVLIGASSYDESPAILATSTNKVSLVPIRRFLGTLAEVQDTSLPPVSVHPYFALVWRREVHEGQLTTPQTRYGALDRNHNPLQCFSSVEKISGVRWKGNPSFVRLGFQHLLPSPTPCSACWPYRQRGSIRGVWGISPQAIDSEPFTRIADPAT